MSVVPPRILGTKRVCAAPGFGYSLWAPKARALQTCPAKTFAPWVVRAHAVGQESLSSSLPALGNTVTFLLALPCPLLVPMLGCSGIRCPLAFHMCPLPAIACPCFLFFCACSRKPLATTLAPTSPQIFPWEHRQKLLFLEKPYVHIYMCVCVFN